MTPLLIALVVLLAVFVQSLVGFGLALVSMPLITAMVGLHTATPLVAVIATTMELVLVITYRKSINLKVVGLLSITSLICVPLGAWALDVVDQDAMLVLLGIVVAGYGVYALLGLKLPSMQSKVWAFLFGAIAGLLGGSLNTNGPPIIIYGDCRRWGPAEFKSNLQGFFLLNNVLIIASHAIAGNFTTPVGIYYLASLPAIALGLFGGIWLSGKIEPERFRKIALAFLVLIGLRLLF